MKKLITLIFISFMFIGNVNAETIEEQLNDLKNKINNLEQKMNNNESNRLNKTYPVGSIFETTTYSSAQEVSNALGGTWEVYGSGKTLVGVDHNDSDFNAVNKTGGGKNTTLTVANLPSHTHSIPALSGTAAQAGAHTHSSTAKSSNITGYFGTVVPAEHVRWASGAFSGNTISSSSSLAVTVPNRTAPIYGYKFSATPTITMTNASAGAHTHSVSTTASNTGSQGSGTAFTNLQPYITVYMYKRVS